MLSGLQEAADRVRESLASAREKMKKYFDKNHRVVPDKFLKGMRVMIFQPKVVQSAQIPKLAWPFCGPYRVLDTKETSVLVRLVDRPNDEGEWIPMERCCRCPDELPDETYTGKGKQRKQIGGKATTKQRRRRRQIVDDNAPPTHTYDLRPKQIVVATDC